MVNMRGLMNIVEAPFRDRESLEDAMDETDRNLYNYVHNELGWPGDMKQLAKRYPLDTPTYCFRGMNFSTKEQYEDFLSKVNSGPVEVGTSSWTPSKSTGEDFAQHKKTYHLSMAVAAAEDEYQKSKESIHGYKGILLGMMITPTMNAVDVRKFKHGAESEVLLPAGTYRLKIIKTFSKFADSVDPKDASARFIAAKPDSREYEYLLKNYKDNFNNAARIKLFNDLFQMKRSTGSLYTSKQEEIYDSPFALEKPSEYFSHELHANVFPVQALELALDDYFPPNYNGLITKMANKSVDRFAAEYNENSKVVMNKQTIGRINRLFDLLGRHDEFTELQRKKIAKPYQHMNSERVKQINSIRDPQKHREAMSQYMADIKDLISRI